MYILTVHSTHEEQRLLGDLKPGDRFTVNNGPIYVVIGPYADGELIAAYQEGCKHYLDHWYQDTDVVLVK